MEKENKWENGILNKFLTGVIPVFTLLAWIKDRTAYSALFGVIAIVVMLLSLFLANLLYSKHKRWAWVCIMVALIPLISMIIAYVIKEDNSIDIVAESQQSFLECLKKSVSDEVVFYDYSDYDGDGHCEMFALVGKKDVTFNAMRGELWFVNRNGSYHIEHQQRLYCREPKIFRIQGQGFLVLEELFATNILSYMWGVKNGYSYETKLSGVGHGITVNQYDEVEVLDMVYDGEEDKKGNKPNAQMRTFKKYYFYLDGEEFREYGGIKITKKDISKIQGIKEIFNIIEKDGYTIDCIYLRENNIYNINLSKGKGNSKKYCNISLRLHEESDYESLDFDSKWEIIYSQFGEQYEGGIYSEAFMPEIATYPNNISD